MLVVAVVVLALAASTRALDCNTEGDCGIGVPCIDKKCTPCESDWDCYDEDGIFPKGTWRLQKCYTKATDGKDLPVNRCDRVPLFEVTHWSQVFILITGCIAILLGGALAAGGGIGGGGLFVPLFILVLRFPARQAIPLSKVTILGGSLTAFVINSRQRLPGADRPLIDFKTLFVLEPTTLVGTMVGVLINYTFPELFITIALSLLLAYNAKRTFDKGKKEWKKENDARRAERGAGTGDAFMRLADGEGADEEKELVANADASDGTELETGVSPTPAVPSAADSPAPGAPTAAAAAALGGASDASGADAKTATAVAAGESDIGVGAAAAAAAAAAASGDDDGAGDAETGGGSEDPAKTAEREKWIQTERRVPRILLVLLVFAFAIILVISLLAGGHGVKSVIGIPLCSWQFFVLEGMSFPLLYVITLWYGHRLVKEHRAKIACGFPFAEGEIQWTRRRTLLYPWYSFIAGVAAGALGIGLLPWDYAIFYFVVGCVASVVGLFVIGVAIRKWKRTSLIVLSLAIVIGASCVLMGVQGVLAVIRGFIVEGPWSLISFNQCWEDNGEA